MKKTKLAIILGCALSFSIALIRPGFCKDALADSRWKKDGNGWKFQVSDDSYAKNQWLKINNKWYYFSNDGYMVTNCYQGGYWLKGDGTWDTKYSHGKWMSNAKGEWYSDNGWYPKSQWLSIDGASYYFDEKGYKLTSQYIDGKWVSSDGKLDLRYTEGEWNSNAIGWWYSDGSYLAKNTTIKIDGVNYSFDNNGYWIDKRKTPIKAMAGIDVSKWQGDIDWSKASKDIDFAVIRCNDHKGVVDTGIDPKFYTNMTNAKKNGVKVGVYYFSVASTEAEAKKEARLAIERVKKSGVTPDLPIFFDIESENAARLTNDQRNKLVKAFADTIRESGYEPGVYASYNWLTTMMDVKEFGDVKVWCAQWEEHQCFMKQKFSFWQYCCKGNSSDLNFKGESYKKVSGIDGDVDLDIMYY